MKSAWRWIAGLGGAAVVTAGVSFGVGATVFRGSRDKVVLLERTARAFSIPAVLMSGKSDAPVTIIEASDFECGFCERVQPVIERLKQEHDGRIRHAFVPYPRGGAAHKAVYGLAYVAAIKQGKGAAFRSALFDRSLKRATTDPEVRRREAMEAVREVARTLEFDHERFDQDMKAPSTKALWEQAVAAVDSAGIRATPTVFVNGYRVRGALELEGYRRVIGTVMAD
jgi:protein-disulfide isomerase